jgi:hypothetical protein
MPTSKPNMLFLGIVCLIQRGATWADHDVCVIVLVEWVDMNFSGALQVFRF